jgi:hypothetical protein
MTDSDIIVSLHLVIPFISMVQTVIYYQGANPHSSLLWLKKLKMLGQVFCNKKSSFYQKGFWSRHIFVMAGADLTKLFTAVIGYIL